MKNFIRNISFVFIANIIVMIVSAVLSLWIPKALSFEGYGYWQLNALFAGYVALLHFGWVDGIYIRYAGTDYHQLDKDVQRSQFRALLIFEIVISTIGIIASRLIIKDNSRFFAISSVFIASAMSIPMGMLLFLLQGGNRIKEYSIATVINKLVYLALCVVALSFGIKDFRIIIFSGIIGTAVSFLYLCIKCKDIVLGHAQHDISVWEETIENIKCGIKVSIAFIAGNLIVGSIRYIIEREWGVETFGKASLTISLTHLIMLFINAVGIVLLPAIRNINENSQKDTYNNLSIALNTIILISFLAYYPLSVLLDRFLPQYSESITWMAIIFPVSLYESRMGLLNNVYLKALRKENGLLIINLLSAFVTIISALIVVFIIHDFKLAMLLIVIMLALRCTISDIYLIRSFGRKISYEIIEGNIGTCVFIIINSLVFSKQIAALFFILFLILTFFFSRKEKKTAFHWCYSKFKR